jgi:hypothetical protein
MKRLICTVRSRSDFRPSARPVEIHEKEAHSEPSCTFRNWCRNGNSRWMQGTPPLPNPSECLAWRGFCKNAAQNIEPQWFRSQNIDFKELIDGPCRVNSTAFASTMVGLFSIRHKVRCHTEADIAVEISRHVTVLIVVQNAFLASWPDLVPILVPIKEQRLSSWTNRALVDNSNSHTHEGENEY